MNLTSETSPLTRSPNDQNATILTESDVTSPDGSVGDGEGADHRGDGYRTNTLGIQFDRIRRYWWLVVAITLVAAICGVAAAATMKTEYTAQAVLSAASPTRAASEDATLAQGYVFVFNDPAYQLGLSDRADIRSDVTSFNAHTASLGPLFYVTATATSADAARTAAAAMAQEFSDEINARISETRDQTITTMTDDLDKVWGDRLAAGDPEAFAAQSELQGQINDLNADRSNRITILQLDAGISQTGPGRIQAVGLALAVGLLVGCVAAILAGMASRRLVTDYDVAEKLRRTVTDVLPASTNEDTARVRMVRVRHLTNLLARHAGAGPTAIAVASANGAGAALLAEEIANHRASQGVPTVLVRANLHCAEGAKPGLAELLDPKNPADLDDVMRDASENLKVIGPGDPKADPFSLFDRARLTAIFAALRERVTFIVVEAPPLASTGEAQLISDVSDVTLLVVESGTQVDDVREAIRALDQVGAKTAGMVLAQ